MLLLSLSFAVFVLGLGSSLYTTSEGSQLPVKIIKQGDGPLTVFITNNDITADHMVDYSLSTQNVTFAANETAKTITVNILEDNDYEGPENFTLGIHSSNLNVSLLQNQAVIVIHDLTGISVSIVTSHQSKITVFVSIVVQVAFNQSQYSILEDEGVVNLTVSRNPVILSISSSLQLHIISQTATSKSLCGTILMSCF